MVKLTFFGHSAFQLEADGQTVLVDPYLTDNPATSIDPDEVNPDTVLLTHAHNDHVGDTVSIAQRTDATVLAIVELAKWLGQQGVSNTIGFNFGGTVDFPGGSAKMVPAWHTSTFGDTFEAPSIPAGFVVRFGGQTMYFAGDTCLFGDMALIGEEGLDIAVLPIGGHFTMDPHDATKAVRLLRATTVIPCHYNTFPVIEQDVDAFKRAVEERTDSTVVILEPGQSHEV